MKKCIYVWYLLSTYCTAHNESLFFILHFLSFMRTFVALTLTMSQSLGFLDKTYKLFACLTRKLANFIFSLKHTSSFDVYWLNSLWAIYNFDFKCKKICPCTFSLQNFHHNCHFWVPKSFEYPLKNFVKNENIT